MDVAVEVVGEDREVVAHEGCGGGAVQGNGRLQARLVAHRLLGYLHKPRAVVFNTLLTAWSTKEYVIDDLKTLNCNGVLFEHQLIL